MRTPSRSEAHIWQSVRHRVTGIGDTAHDGNIPIRRIQASQQLNGHPLTAARTIRYCRLARVHGATGLCSVADHWRSGVACDGSFRALAG